jgi:hypothetical protein
MAEKHLITGFPLGNADCCLIDLKDGQKMLIDFGNQHNPNDPADTRCDLAAELRTDMRKAGRDNYNVVCFTHLDADHCDGASDFFYFEYAAKYQTAGRFKMDMLWVPAAAITEEGLEDCGRVIRQEARHRFRQGKGIRVFSRPERLKAWCEKNEIDFESRKHLIVDAGTLVPGFTKNSAAGVEFFVHSPFAWRTNENRLEDRNEDSIVFQATFVADGAETYAIFGSDVNYESLSLIVQTTKRHKQEDRLRWHFMKLPHHSSYRSVGPDRGQDETVAVPDVKWLFETQGQQGAYILSTSWPIPVKGSVDDKSDQPPHRQAANHHRRVVKEKSGQFVVTMETPNTSKPKSIRFEISRFGIALLLAAPGIISMGTAAAAQPTRAG